MAYLFFLSVFGTFCSSIIILLGHKFFSFRFVTSIAIFTLFSALLSSIYCCYFLLSFSGVFFFDFSEYFKWYLFCSPNGLQLNINFLFDELCFFMCILVLLVSLCVHIYSVEYMFYDPDRNLFIGYLSLFTSFMLFLVSSGTFVQFFIGWEGIGLCSYLLINFWYMRLEANKAAIKAVVVNKIGDCAFVIGTGLIYYYFKTFNFYTVLSILSTQKLSFFIFFKTFFFFEIDGLTLLALFFLIAVMGKSAQIGLHTWLPDAMEGPTPVSALIHAATMVTAGIFLVIRCSKIFEFAPTILVIMLIVGSLTAFMAATIACFQSDIKKIIAYSTCSQLGYMLAGCGLSQYGIAFFHLFTHGFFKALLFLVAGAILHGVNDVQDIRLMPVFVDRSKFLDFCLLIGSSSLTATFFFSGFYSKELIIFSSFFAISFANWVGLFSYILLVVTAFLTILYSGFIYWGSYGSGYGTNTIFHASMFFVNFALSVLLFFAVFIGFVFSDYFLFFNNSFFISNYYFDDALNWWVAFFVGFMLFFYNIVSLDKLPFFKSVKILCSIFYKKFEFFVFMFSKKWYFDIFLNNFFSIWVFKWMYKVFYLLDVYLFEWFGVKGIIFGLTKNARILLSIQTGSLYLYFFITIFSIIVFANVFF